MTSKMLALDLGSQWIGWARGSPGQDPAFGTHRMPEVEQGDIATLMVDLRSLLHRLGHGVELVSYEAPVVVRGNNPFTMRKVFALGGLVELFCHDQKVECVEAGIGSIRKHFLGKGYAHTSKDVKGAVMARCRMLGWQVKTTHEADALAVLDYTMSVRGAALRLFG